MINNFIYIYMLVHAYLGPDIPYPNPNPKYHTLTLTLNTIPFRTRDRDRDRDREMNKFYTLNKTKNIYNNT